MLYIVFHLSQSWFCACAWYLLAAGVLFWYQLYCLCYLLLILALNTLDLDISLNCLCLSIADFGLNTLDFDISLLSLVSNAKTDESELVLCSCMISTNTEKVALVPWIQCVDTYPSIGVLVVCYEKFYICVCQNIILYLPCYYC